MRVQKQKTTSTKGIYDKPATLRHSQKFILEHSLLENEENNYRGIQSEKEKLSRPSDVNELQASHPQSIIRLSVLHFVLSSFMDKKYGNIKIAQKIKLCKGTVVPYNLRIILSWHANLIPFWIWNKKASIYMIRTRATNTLTLLNVCQKKLTTS